MATDSRKGPTIETGLCAAADPTIETANIAVRATDLAQRIHFAPISRNRVPTKKTTIAVTVQIGMIVS